MTLFYPPDNPFFIIADILQVMVLLILVEVIVSWGIMMGSVSAYRPWVRTLRRITEPLLAPFRRIIPPGRMGGLDISPMIAIFLLQLLMSLVARLGMRQ